MTHQNIPDPNRIYPIAGYKNEIYVKPTITSPNIEVGDFTYIASSNFEKHVTHHYEHLGDKLRIGKFCQIGHGVEFMMAGAMHQMNAATTYPFFTIKDWEAPAPAATDLPEKGDTVIGNDVWVGDHVTFLPGVHVGDGAIIGTHAVVSADVAPYTVVAGNPARLIRNRFDKELTELLLAWRWWDKPAAQIKELVPLLTSSDLEALRRHIVHDLN